MNGVYGSPLCLSTNMTKEVLYCYYLVVICLLNKPMCYSIQVKEDQTNKAAALL